VLSTKLIFLAALCSAAGQDRKLWPKPEIMVAPAYPNSARAREIVATITVIASVDQDGNVIGANATNGPCRYSSPSPTPQASPCDFAREAATHHALAERFRNEALDMKLSDLERKAKFKQFDTEDWLAAQLDLYAAAEHATRQWLFQWVPRAKSPAIQYVPLTFRFSKGDVATIQVIDSWTINVVAATYPAGD
jgi:hypothetical protein